VTGNSVENHARRHARLRLNAALLCLSPLTAIAAPAADDTRAPRFEIAALVGYRSGGDFDALTGTDNPNIQPDMSYGVSVGWLSDSETTYELLYDLQRTRIQGSDVDLDVEHLHLASALTYGGTDEWNPYISGGLGATRLQPSTGADETRFSMSLALGVGVPVSEHVAVRLEVRGYLVFMDGNSNIFCSSGAAGGTCLVRAAGDTLFQYAAIGGIAVRF
jgi:opacity protein-like surface antigen